MLRENPRVPAKSRDIPPDISNFLAPTPSRGRPLPHRRISGPKSLGLGSFVFPHSCVKFLKKKILVSVKHSCPQFWGRKWLRQFYGRLEFLFSLCRKTSMSIKFLVLGGGGFGVGGGKCRFYFYGCGDFSDKCGFGEGRLKSTCKDSFLGVQKLTRSGLKGVLKRDF